MPAIYPPRTLARPLCVALTLIGSLFASAAAMAQTDQLPSQRYLPVRQNAYQQAQQQAAMQQPARSQMLPDARRLPSSMQASALAPAPSIPAQDAYYPEQNRNPMVRPTSYQEPLVPNILAGQRQQSAPLQPSKQPATQPSTNGFSVPQVSPIPNGDLMERRSPADFAGQMGQRPASPLGIRPKAEVGQQPQDNRPITLRQTLAPQPQVMVPVNAAPQTQSVDAEQSAARGESLTAAAERIPAENGQAESVSAAAAEMSETSEANQPVSATQFVAEINRQAGTQAKSQTGTQQEPGAPRLVAKQGTDPISPAMQLATGQHAQYATPVAAGQSGLAQAKDTELKLGAPSIDVVAIGPETIGINKPSQYKIVIRNNSTQVAEQILVGVNLPEWIDIETISMTSGGKELTDGRNRARIVWSVDQVPGNATQTLTVTAIPRKAEMFDVGLEWTLVPRSGKTAIRVTEPKLEMSISGPKEVLYGETALYHVAVRNPGTGAAENVTIKLPEALGGESQPLGIIPPGKEKNLQIELLARTAGDLNLVATASAEGNLKTAAERALKVRRANLQVSMAGPPLKYAGGVGEYQIKITNTGDATATDVIAAVALPAGVKYLKGIEAVKLIEGGMRWSVGSIDQQQTKTYRIFCQLDTSGDLQLEVGTQGAGELAASGACLTTVETIADLVLSVADPKGPLPTGEKVPYTIKIRNRGTRAAKGVDLVMLFSEGIEPRDAKGIQHKIVPGQVKFSPIGEIAPGQEVSFEVIAEAMKSGTHVFRAELTCQDSDAREMAEGTTRFFGDDIASPPAASTAEKVDNNSNGFELK